MVLDTNIVLDWLVFADASLRPLADQVATGEVVILTHPAAVDELQRVLTYPALRLDAERQTAVLAHYCAQTVTPPLPAGFAPTNLLLPEHFPRCRDADDQHFLALAWHARAQALVSRDRAVLSLAQRAAKFAVRILDVTQMTQWLRR
jgi:putative PIN family toxin of toxin-antitoxin system